MHKFNYNPRNNLIFQYLCYAQQIYIRNGMFVFILKDGKTAIIGKMLKNQDGWEFTYHISHNFGLERLKCDQKNKLSIYQDECCREKALSVIFNNHFYGIINDDAMEDSFTRCLKFGEEIKLSEILVRKFKPKNITD
ncbi:hypothetical protein GVAV_000644 [Gurleya vavrai]